MRTVTLGALAAHFGRDVERGVAKAVGIAPDRISIHAVHVGADFGGKSGAGELPIWAAISSRLRT